MAAEAAPPHLLAAPAEDPHRAGSVDHALFASQTLVTAANQADLYRAPPGGPPRPLHPRPWLEAIVGGVIAGSVHDFQRATALRRWVAAVPHTFPEGETSTRQGFWGDFRTFLCGGTEEEIIRKGSPLAAELSRVLVTLAMLAGLNARLAFLFDDQASERHTVVEVFTGGRWTAFDPVSDRCYIWPKHGYASAWDIHQMPALVDGLQDHGRLPYVSGRFYRSVAIAVYDPWDGAHRFPWDPLDPATAGRLHAGRAG